MSALHRSQTNRELQNRIRDFSKSAISKANVSEALHHWTFRYSTAALIGSLIFGVIIGLSEPVFWFSLGTVVTTIASYAFHRYYKAGQFERMYVLTMNKQIEQETIAKRELLAEELTKHHCSEGAQQLEQLQADFDSLVELLETKLDRREITFQRYHGMIQEVYLSGIDNLRTILTTLMSVSEIDTDVLKAKIDKLKQDDSPTASHEREILQKRITLKDLQDAKVRTLLVQNEEAITKMELTAAAIAEMDTGQNEGKRGMESSMNDLARITRRAEQNREIKRTIQEYT